jgi:hypothetical protein
MKHELALLKADIQEELSKLERVLAEFRPFVSQLDLTISEASDIASDIRIVLNWTGKEKRLSPGSWNPPSRC